MGPRARISGGVVAGIFTTGNHATEQNERAHAFLGIPFAAAPVGPARFAPPQPPAGWGGVRDCTRHGPEPVQRDEGQLPFQLARSGETDPATGLPDYVSTTICMHPLTSSHPI